MWFVPDGVAHLGPPDVSRPLVWRSVRFSILAVVRIEVEQENACGGSYPLRIFGAISASFWHRMKLSSIPTGMTSSIWRNKATTKRCCAGD